VQQHLLLQRRVVGRGAAAAVDGGEGVVAVFRCWLWVRAGGGAVSFRYTGSLPPPSNALWGCPNPPTPPPLPHPPEEALPLQYLVGGEGLLAGREGKAADAERLAGGAWAQQVGKVLLLELLVSCGVGDGCVCVCLV